MRCQYCGKNLWPLRGLFDEDFCSRDHRQRYHERVRKALEHLPKFQAGPRPAGIAGFQFEKPRVQEPAFAMRNPGMSHEQPAACAGPGVAPASAVPALSPASMSPNIMSIDSLRHRLHQSQGALAVAMIERPAAIPPRALDRAIKSSHRAAVMPQTFDELNHVFVHEPDPVLEAGMPVAQSLMMRLTPLATSARPKHTAAAGPSGTGRVEFFPLQPLSRAGVPASASAQDALPEIALPAGENIWLEDPMSWHIPVSLAPTRSALAVLPAVDREAALERVRNLAPAAASAQPLEWRFEAMAARRSAIQAPAPAVASAMVIEFPAPRDQAAEPLSDETAYFDAANFSLYLPEVPAMSRDLEMLETLPADLTPAQADAFGPQTKIGETLLPRATGWFPIDAGAVMPRSPEVHGALAEPKVGADLAAKAVPSQLRSGARRVESGLPVSLPSRAVRLEHGPAFFAAEPMVADSVARPVSARPRAFARSLSLPAGHASESHTLLKPAAGRTLLPTGALVGEAAMIASAEMMHTVNISVPAIDTAPAGFGRCQRLEKVEVRFRDTGDRSAHSAGWIDPQLTLCIPEMNYGEYPLALKVDTPEPRTVTVFETATIEQGGKVVSINEARSKRFAVPSYIKGMAAGVMLASFLWFGSSSIKSDGITMRPGDLLRLTIQRRAVYETGDNFHAGLVSWDGGKNLGKTWIYDKEGFVRPGRLALYKPSRDMSDYRLEFLVQVERKGLGWVYRAVDEQNYYAMKLAVTEPGPRPLMALVRYQVVDGKKASRGETPLQIMMHNNRPYRVQVDVKGNTFLTSIEGQLVDSWSDSKLKSGGVGFFTEGSEKARLYWMKVTKNSDFLGKLCSILVPKES